MWMAFSAAAFALTLSLESEETPYPGVTLRAYTTTSPDTNTWVVLVDLCEADLHVESTYPTELLQTAGSWGAETGVQVAVNGDFYLTGPLQVYGDAVGGGIGWPLEQTGLDPSFSSSWYYGDFGWIAFGFDRVEFTHSGWVKENAAAQGLTADQGWAASQRLPPAAPGMLSLVSGFPEIVVQGTPMVCADPEDSSCFPDRSDMRDRHPRTAMGIDLARTTLMLAVVDGRTSASDGMYGSELADLMGQLGAWEAFNLDGGGSTQLWLEDRGYVNDTSGNNFGGSTRAVANHWGIRAGGSSDAPARPGHCEGQPACQEIPPGGATIDDVRDCFRLFGPPEWWREESIGIDGRSYWTNAWDSETSLNWAWWQLSFAEAGTYAVEVYTEPGFTAFDDAHYVVVAEEASEDVRVDLGALTGWWTLGTWSFAAGGDQLVAVYDDAPDGYGTDRQIPVDAIRVTRVGPFCGDAACDAATETWETCPADCAAPPEDTGDAPLPGVEDDPEPLPEPALARREASADRCGCASGGNVSGASFLLLIAGIGAARGRPVRRPGERRWT